jgi:hypothetical protein
VLATCTQGYRKIIFSALIVGLSVWHKAAQTAQPSTTTFKETLIYSNTIMEKKIIIFLKCF